MTRRRMITGGGVILVVLGVIAAATWLALNWATAHEIAAGREIYGRYCAGCHGPELEGQPNWQERLSNARLPAPPHDASGHTWHHTDADLFRITKGGLAAIVPDYASDMPAFAGTLSDDEIRAVLAFIKSTWPTRERDYQARRS